MIPPRSLVSSVYCASPGAIRPRSFESSDCEELRGARPLDLELAHVGDVEDAAVAAHRAVLGDDALVLHRHLPAGERAPCARRPRRGARRGASGGASASGRDASACPRSRDYVARWRSRRVRGLSPLSPVIGQSTVGEPVQSGSLRTSTRESPVGSSSRRRGGTTGCRSLRPRCRSSRAARCA